MKNIEQRHNRLKAMVFMLLQPIETHYVISKYFPKISKHL